MIGPGQVEITVVDEANCVNPPHNLDTACAALIESSVITP